MNRKPLRPWEVAALEELYPSIATNKLAALLGRSESSIYNQAFILGLHKTPEYLAGPDACRLRRGGNIGSQSRFKKGQVPHNKGIRMPGWAPGRMAQTQFRKGHVSANWAPLGTERVSDDGYLKRKVALNGKQIERWRMVHVLLWEEHHGPIPAGHTVIFKDKDKTNIVLQNLELVSRRQLMQRNSVHRWGPEVFQVIQLRGALNRKIRSCNEKQNV
ncbi:MAG TPA: HNH endonuclease signature motif containing protein [Acidobacteriaceae bacterium]